MMRRQLDLAPEAEKAEHARLEALLKHGRNQLSGQFSTEEFTALLDCFPGDVFSPHDIDDLPGMLAGHVGGTTPLVRKVAALTDLQRFALADVIEQSWHLSAGLDVSILDVVERRGVRLN